MLEYGHDSNRSVAYRTLLPLWLFLGLVHSFQKETARATCLSYRPLVRPCRAQRLFPLYGNAGRNTRDSLLLHYSYFLLPLFDVSGVTNRHARAHAPFPIGCRLSFLRISYGCPSIRSKGVVHLVSYFRDALRYYFYVELQPIGAHFSFLWPLLNSPGKRTTAWNNITPLIGILR